MISSIKKRAEKEGLESTGIEKPWTVAGDRGSARAGKPRWFRILVIASLSRMEAMIFIFPPHCGQCSMSISNTRLSKRAQLIRTVAWEGGAASFAFDA